MTPWADVHSEMASERMGNFHLEGVISSKPQEHQKKTAILRLDACKVWSCSRSSTLQHQPVKDWVSSSCSLVVLRVILVRACSDQEQPVYGTQPSAKQWPPKQLHHWFPSVTNSFIAMQHARQAERQVSTMCSVDIVMGIHLQHCHTNGEEDNVSLTPSYNLSFPNSHT